MSPRRTPLFDEHVALGARMVDFAGWEMPVQYTSILAEHRAVREAAGLFDVSHMGEIEITGPGATDLCARLFTNDARRLPHRRAQYSMIASEDGGVVDDVIVYRGSLPWRDDAGASCADGSDARFLVCVNASNAAADFAWIEAHREAGDGAVVTDLGDETALLAVQGPAAVAIVEGLAPGVASIARMACAPATVAGVRVLAARSGYTGEDGFELFCAATDAVALWGALLEAGRPSGLLPCGLGARDTLRIEAALPLYGHELGPDISPFEVGLGWAVKTGREGMVAGEALARAAADVRRRLVGLFVEGGIAREGAAVFLPGGGEPVGHVTSGTHSPTLGRAVAMALVEADRVPAAAGEAAVAPATALEVEVRGKRRAALVTRLPFCVKRARA